MWKYQKMIILFQIVFTSSGKRKRPDKLKGLFCIINLVAYLKMKIVEYQCLETNDT